MQRPPGSFTETQNFGILAQFLFGFAKQQAARHAAEVEVVEPLPA